MSETKTKLSGPDLAGGIALSAVPDGALLLGHAQGEPVLLARRGDELFAIGNVCTHYDAPLNEGLLVDDTVRCPWHHACFSLRTGEAIRAPALDPVPCWRVEQQDGNVFVREKLEQARKQVPVILTDRPRFIVIIGGGAAAGNAAAETLRKEGYTGRITMLSADASVPCDRPKLSKSYLAGIASSVSNSLRSPEFYQQHDIDLKLGAHVATIDTASRHVQLANGSLQRKSQMAVLLEFIKTVLAHPNPADKLKEFTEVVDNVFQLMPSGKHMVGRDLGRLEPTPSLQCRAAG